MNKTKIEWCTHTWNPVTGCRHGCPYCYARAVARRFSGHTDILHAAEHPEEYEGPTIHDLEEPLINGESKAPYPFDFEPTFHRYRLNEPGRATAHRDIFVCSMADLFGRWVPTDWIVSVLDACRTAPQHRYLFLTKNPSRYLELDQVALLPHGVNFWYGSSVTHEDAVAMYPHDPAINAFWSMEPLLGPVHMEEADGLPGWVILGAETGNRKGKVVPRREWVDEIAAFCADHHIPVFYKGNLREYFPDLPASAFPWEVAK